MVGCPGRRAARPQGRRRLPDRRATGQPGPQEEGPKGEYMRPATWRRMPAGRATVADGVEVLYDLPDVRVVWSVCDVMCL
jgi:hypothetical protein